jgi:plastocyanin
MTDGDDVDCGNTGGGQVPSTSERGHCDDHMDNDGDGKTDSQDSDCEGGGGGPSPNTSPSNQLSRGGNEENGVSANTVSSLTGSGGPLPEAIAQLVQTAEGQIEGDIYYILIEHVNNETRFVPDKVTVSSGFTVVWINNDISKEHQVVLTNVDGEPLLNAAVSYNNFIKYKFESDGKFFYSDTENSKSYGIVTVVPNREDNVKISGPLPGIETIISSLGLK